MIVYNLRCDNAHEFEGWFRDSTAFDMQAKDGLLRCPTCDSVRIERAIMAPAIVAGGRKDDTAKADARDRRQFMTGLRKYVQDHADYVGPNFAEEARKIHYGETAERHIYGEATAEDAQALADEGVDIALLPPDIEN